MNENTRNEFAFYGLKLLKDAVLEALYKERDNRWKGLLRIRISERLGIPKPGEYDAHNADLIGGILWHLEEDGSVENIGNNRWRITERGVSKIEGGYTHDIFSKDVLCNIITDNLDILRQCIEGTIYQKWTAVVLLMQFIEYLLKYKIQSAGDRFCKIHEIEKLYCDLTDDERNAIERIFTKLMKDRKVRDPKSFDSIEDFARRYNTAYKYYWRYGILNTNSNSDEEYFYLADTVTVLRSLIESTDLKIDLPSIVDEDKLAQKILKDDVRWGYVP